MAQLPIKPPRVDAAELKLAEEGQGARCSFVIVCGAVFKGKTYTIVDLSGVFNKWYAAEKRVVGVEWSWSLEDITFNPIHVKQLRFLSPKLESVSPREGFCIHGIAPWGHEETLLRMVRLIADLRLAFRQDYVELWVGRRSVIAMAKDDPLD